MHRPKQCFNLTSNMRMGFQEVMQEAKQKANHIKEPWTLWDLKHYLTERHKESAYVSYQRLRSSKVWPRL